jgi:hypothetical protein
MSYKYSHIIDLYLQEITVDELLKKLLEAEILTPETKEELSEAFTQHIQSTLAEAEEENKIKIRAELTEQWIKEREVLIEAIDSKVGDLLQQEIGELKEDVDKFRDLEAEYAEKIVEARASMAEELKDDMAKLVVHIDNFLSESLAAEFQELHEDIEEVKKNEFGRKIFEAFTNEFYTSFVDEDSLQAKLHEAQAKAEAATRKLNEAAKINAKLIRESKLNDLLAPLSSYQREVMSTILETTATEKLDQTFNQFVGRIIKESVDHSSEKESQVLAESEKSKETKTSIIEEKVIVKTGNAAPSAVERVQEGVLSESDINALRRMSGINR